MNDNDKFKKFFGFGSDDSEQIIDMPTDSVISDKQDLEKAQVAAAEWADKYLSLTADFQNYKKRIIQEKTDWAQDAQKLIFIDLLGVIDNFERALEQEKKRENAEGIAWLTGFEMIYQSLEKVLLKFSVQVITDFSVFNPKYHEALIQVDSQEHKSGDIVQVLQKGYIMNDKLIRPAIVSVAK